MNRRQFISMTSAIGLLPLVPGKLSPSRAGFVMTVTGKLRADKLGLTLPHEHFITDFRGAEISTDYPYEQKDALDGLLPLVRATIKAGANTIVECTPAGIGRNVKLLQEISLQTRVNIITNTGYYAAAAHKYLPPHAFSESAEDLAARWISEWEEGIDQTEIRPGFIKLGMDAGTAGEIEKKLLRAAAITHLRTGLKIAVHCGDAVAAKDSGRILVEEGVGMNGFIWVHAQNDSTGNTLVELARSGCWISLDGVRADENSTTKYVQMVTRLKEAGLINRLLLSHDDGFTVSSDQGQLIWHPYQHGNTSSYTSLFYHLQPALLKNGFTRSDFRQISVRNTAEAYSIRICRNTRASQPISN